jgi:hypothetical protein
LIRRPKASVSHDKPEAVNPNSDPGFFNSSSVDDFNLEDEDETNPGTSFSRPAAPLFGTSDQDSSFFRSATPSFGTSHQYPSFCYFAPPSFEAQSHMTRHSSVPLLRLHLRSQLKTNRKNQKSEQPNIVQPNEKRAG